MEGMLFETEIVKPCRDIEVASCQSTCNPDISMSNHIKTTRGKVLANNYTAITLLFMNLKNSYYIF